MSIIYDDIGFIQSYTIGQEQEQQMTDFPNSFKLHRCTAHICNITLTAWHSQSGDWWLVTGPAAGEPSNINMFGNMKLMQQHSTLIIYDLCIGKFLFGISLVFCV